MAIIQWIYATKSSTPLSTRELDEILRMQRPKYLERSLTGLLIYARQRCLGILEGDEAEVTAVQAVIERYPHHNGITHFRNQTKSDREFNDWSMSYVRQGSDKPDGYLPLNPENAFDEIIALESDVSYYVSRFRAAAFSLDEQFSNRRKASSRNVA